MCNTNASLKSVSAKNRFHELALARHPDYPQLKIESGLEPTAPMRSAFCAPGLAQKLLTPSQIRAKENKAAASCPPVPEMISATRVTRCEQLPKPSEINKWWPDQRRTVSPTASVSYLVAEPGSAWTSETPPSPTMWVWCRFAAAFDSRGRLSCVSMTEASQSQTRHKPSLVKSLPNSQRTRSREGSRRRGELRKLLTWANTEHVWEDATEEHRQTTKRTCRASRRRRLLN